ncbi:MAG: M3 family metallopeptidase [Prevotella sp.]|nr:M3 family metallopeptidase [Prevotella sp.]MCM1074230.1 M3 family metallopeptidase [Ruminococcus sp.]
MKHKFLTAAAVALTMVCASNSQPMQARENPFLQPYTAQYEIPPFEQIQTADFLPAVKAGIAEQQANLKKIIENPEAPTFENTIMPLENLSPTLDRVAAVFYHYDSAMKTPEFSEAAETIMPMLEEAGNEVALSEPLFARIKTLKEGLKKSKLNPVQKRLIEKYYRQFAEQGAALSPEQKKELVRVNAELSKLYMQFNKNLLKATNDFSILVYDKADLAGLPESSVATAAEAAKARGLDGLYVFTLHAPSRLPVLQYADNRGLREAMWKGYTSLASTGETSNIPVIEKIVKLRNEKAKIMGFKDYASFMTSKVMAGTPEAAEELLMKVYEPAKNKVKEEVAEMQAYVDTNGGGFSIQPWDYYYYTNKVKQDKFNLSETDLQPYFELSHVLDGLKYCANKLYGINFVEMPDAPKYMDEVTVYDIQDKDGKHLSVFMTDFFPRNTKIQGAWMEQMQSAGEYENGVMKRPIVYNVGNFTPPTADNPSLLTLDEVETTFHEFGHALQGMLTQAPYKSLAGTNVDRDYVELCSQINEHWATAPEVLKVYAKHYKTGETIPDELIVKMKESGNFGQGFTAAELSAAALLDMAIAHESGENFNVADFEKAYAEKIGLPAELTFRYRPTYFKHIFGDEGYAAGYYTYLWSQVLEADAWELFEQKGIFDPKTAASFKKNILESGDTEDAMKLFVKFRGHKPSPEALLRLRGLNK